ncbi:MAG: MotA/TolQ/ExbB proton channel family protein [Campylobacterales bacterium]|nr:MotA/TolQ/ExbB proton channel family protein [Campylobacterales bacterium]
MTELLNQFIGYMQGGGYVMWPLFFANMILWYGLAYRYIVMQRGRKKSARVLIDSHMKKGENKKQKGILDMVIHDSIKVYKEMKDNPNLRDYIQSAQYPYIREVKKFSIIVTTIIILAPLIGLLGTVIGMIETFDSLGSSTLFSQGGGIAGGISQALFTTQLGLIVAAPGLVLGRMLDKKQQNLELEFEQVKDILSTREGK